MDFVKRHLLPKPERTGKGRDGGTVSLRKRVGVDAGGDCGIGMTQDLGNRRQGNPARKHGGSGSVTQVMDAQRPGEPGNPEKLLETLDHVVDAQGFPLSGGEHEAVVRYPLLRRTSLPRVPEVGKRVTKERLKRDMPETRLGLGWVEAKWLSRCAGKCPADHHGGTIGIIDDV